MTTTSYFDQSVIDATTEHVRKVECGTSGFAGDGPRMYLKVDDREVFFSHEDAQKFCEGVASVAGYLGYGSRVT